MLKRKFENNLMLRKEVGQINEALAKVLCHNICCLIAESYETGLRLEFAESAHLFPTLHNNSVKFSEKV